MRSRLRDNAPAAAAAAVAIYVVGWLSLYAWAWTDYDSEARPAFDALVSGHLLRFLQLAPGYGGSLVLRAPFVLSTTLWGGGQLAIYRAAAVPCLIATAILGVWLVARMRTLGRPRSARAIALFLCVANPITLPALEIGHPEELLGAVLCIAAVIVATRGRPVWAGVLLGLAIANKDWALLATGPVLIALPDRRPRAMLAAVAVAGAVLAPLALAGSGGFIAQTKAATDTGQIFNPWQLWWFLGSHAHVVRNISGQVMVGYRAAPAWIESAAHPLIIAIALPLTLLCGLLRRGGTRRPAQQGLLLLVLLLGLRFALDPWDISYYALPFLLTLVVWETLTHDRPPVLALAATFAAWFVFQWANPSHGFSPDMEALLFGVLVIPALLAIAAALYAPGLSERVAVRVRRRPAVTSPPRWGWSRKRNIRPVSRPAS